MRCLPEQSREAADEVVLRKAGFGGDVRHRARVGIDFPQPAARSAQSLMLCR
jgi:hypothetical protein